MVLYDVICSGSDGVPTFSPSGFSWSPSADCLTLSSPLARPTAMSDVKGCHETDEQYRKSDHMRDCMSLYSAKIGCLAGGKKWRGEAGAGGGVERSRSPKESAFAA
jgi:hypothetical protein